MTESEQAQEAWSRRCNSDFKATNVLAEYKAALKADIEKELIEDERAYSQLSQTGLRAIVKRGISEKKRFLSLLDTVTPIK